MYYEITILEISKCLRNLSEILNKAASFAEQKKFDPQNLLEARLAPDQFNLLRQIQIACDTAKFTAGRLSQKAMPSFPDDEKNLADLQSRIQATLDYLASFSPDDFATASATKVSLPRWDGQHLNGDEYLLQHAMPNFFFHYTTSYAILRNNGVEIGKKDYLGPMPYKK